MKKTKQVRKMVLEEYVVKHTCDICHGDVKEEAYSVDEVSIRIRQGICFPEGGTYTETTIDCCTTCFLERVMPLLQKEFACTFREEEHDY